MTLRVDVYDTETGYTTSEEIDDDFLVITAGRYYVANTQVFKSTGTHQITIKVADERDD